MTIRMIAIDEMAKNAAMPSHRRWSSSTRTHKCRSRAAYRFKFGADTELILAYHLFEIIEASFEIVAPHGRALQALGGANVEHQERSM